MATAEFSKAWYKFWSNQYLPSTHFWSSALCQRPLTDAGHSLGEDTDHVNIIQIKQAGWSTEDLLGESKSSKMSQILLQVMEEKGH